jgi:hypothetical protein
MVGPSPSTWANVPLEDEPIGEDEARSVAEAREWRLHNDLIPNEDVLPDYGLSSADFKRHEEYSCGWRGRSSVAECPTTHGENSRVHGSRARDVRALDRASALDISVGSRGFSKTECGDVTGCKESTRPSFVSASVSIGFATTITAVRSKHSRVKHRRYAYR